MSAYKPRKEPYHLYSQRREAFGGRAPCFQDWLVNNAATYTHTATVQAYTPEEAYSALQQKRDRHGYKARFVTVHERDRFQSLGPGDILVGANQAWMVMSDATLTPIPYNPDQPWKSYQHKNQIYDLSWSPDGLHVAACDDSCLVCIHTLSAPETSSSTSYRRHGQWSPYAVAWSPDGSRIASGSYDGEVHIWRPAPGAGYRQAAKGSLLICREERMFEDRITRIVWAPDSNSVFAGRENGAMIRWHAVTGQHLSKFSRHKRAITDLAWSPDGTRLASASRDATVRVWQLLDDPDQDVIYRGHTDEVLALSWSPHGDIISGGKHDRFLHVWNPETGEPKERIPLSISSVTPLSINTVAWSPTGRFVAAGCNDGTLQLVDMEQKRHLLTYRTNNRYGVNAVAWSPDGWFVASGGNNGWQSASVEIWPVGMDMVALQQGGKQRYEKLALQGADDIDGASVTYSYCCEAMQ